MKKRRILSLLCFWTGISFCVSAQSTKSTVDNLSAYVTKDSIQGWTHSGLVGITFGQTSLHNWVAGGDNTISGNVILNGFANYVKDKWFWDNKLSLEYGMVYSSSYNWQKNADKINLTSVAGRKITNKWSTSFLLNFNTQFAKGYNYPNTENYISTFMAPAYTDAALGFTYKPNKKYTLFISPIAEKVTFVLNDSLSSIGTFGVERGKTIKWETGAYLMASTSQTVYGNIGIISSLNLFTPYDKNFGNIDVNWDLLISYKIKKMFTATLNTALRYYDNEIKRIQFKEILGLGLTYTF
ncbi:MAG: DUF3078 domain-containing protein [Dysgonamonadaceae bacterium]|jgi:hypothetical protein|nr:DUF3078 domain-containing protein [Dysgonamonadaceae bacterium]